MLKIGVKLRKARLSQDLSLRELAAKAEVSASLLSQIENGKVNPSAMSLYSIAAALKLPMDYFFPDPLTESADTTKDGSRGSSTKNRVSTEHRPAKESSVSANMDAAIARHKQDDPVLRKDHRAKIELMGGVKWARLTANQSYGIEFLEITYEVGGSSGPALSRHEGREFGLLLEGELTLELGFEKYILEPGDSIIFNSTTPHRLTNTGTKTLRAIWVNFLPSQD